MDKCPNCGYIEPTTVKRLTNVMNEYVVDETGKSYGMMNSDEKILTVGKPGATFKVRRKDVAKEVKVEAPKVPEVKK